MGDPHVSLLGRLVRAVEQGDVATIAGLFAENAVWHLPGATGAAETCEGREMILGLLGKLLEATEGDFRVVLYEAVPDGEGATWWCRLPSGGGDADAPIGLAVRIDQERIVEVWQGEGWPAFAELPVPGFGESRDVIVIGEGAMYDVIVVGARCAGSPTAMLLARLGYRVLLLDRASFPSDTMSTHYVMTPGVARLERWGLRATVAASNCPPLRQITFDFGDFALTGSAPGVDGVDEQYAIRRFLLDKILVDAAVDAGVELRERFVVEDLVTDGDRVVGIRGREGTGAEVTERARLVVGADGLHSLVARAVGAPVYAEKPSLTCCAYSYWSGLALDCTEAYARPGRSFYAFPTNDGLACIFMFWPAVQAAVVRSNIEDHFLQTLDQAPGFSERVRAGSREARFVSTADLPNFFRRPYGPGWALVGDAGYHKDPFLAQGISDAFRDAGLLAEAVDAGLSGRQSLAGALAEYERLRNEAAMPGYEFNAQLASHEPFPPEMVELFRALQGNQEETDRFLGTICGTVPVQDFYAPENVGSIIAAARGPKATARPQTSG